MFPRQTCRYIWQLPDGAQTLIKWFFILPKCLIFIIGDLCFFFISSLFPLLSYWLRGMKSDHFSRVFICHETKKSFSNLRVKKPAQVNWAAVHRLENPMVYTGLCMRPGILTINLQGGQLMEHTLKLSKSGSSGGKWNSPKSGVITLQGCPLASKEQGPARAWGTYQYCFCLP